MNTNVSATARTVLGFSHERFLYLLLCLNRHVIRNRNQPTYVFSKNWLLPRLLTADKTQIPHNTHSFIVLPDKTLVNTGTVRILTQPLTGAAVAQGQSQLLVIARLLVPFPWSACQSVHGQDIELLTAADVLQTKASANINVISQISFFSFF